MPESISITDAEKFPLGPVSATDVNGKPTKLGGTVVMTSSDPTLLTVTDNGDGTWEATSVADGNAIINVTDGVLTDTVDVSITPAPPGPEAHLVIPLGAPVPK